MGKYSENLKMTFQSALQEDEVKGKILEAFEQKVIQIGLKDRENMRNYKGLINQDTVDFVQFPRGEKGLRVRLNDGTYEYWKISLNGELTPMVEFEDTYHPNFFMDKVERFFGITLKMRNERDPKIDKIHIIMFVLFALLGFGALLGGLFLFGVI